MEGLIAGGHAFHDVLNVYTVPQLEAFAAAASRRKRREIVEMAISVRAAAAPDQRAWESFVEKAGEDERETPADRLMRQLGKLGLVATEEPHAGS